MKKELLENALYTAVDLVLKMRPYEHLKGYLVKDQYNPKRYKILPLDISKDIIVFPASYVKEYITISNGFLVK